MPKSKAQSQQTLSFGVDSANGTSQLKFPNDVIGLAWRNQLDSGNIELKVNSSDFLDLTNSANDTVVFSLRAQDASFADISSSWTQAPNVAGLGGTTSFTYPTEFAINHGAGLRGLFTSDDLFKIFNENDIATAVFNEPVGSFFALSLESQILVDFESLTFKEFNQGGSDVGAEISHPSTGLRYLVEDNTLKHIFSFGNGGTIPLTDVLEISAGEINVKSLDITNIDREIFVKDSGVVSVSGDTTILFNSNNQFQFNTDEGFSFVSSFDNDAALVLDDSIGTNQRILSLQSESDDINSAPFFKLTKAFNIPLVTQTIGEFSFNAGTSAGSGNVQYSAINSRIENVTAGFIEGSIGFDVTINNSPFQIMRLNWAASGDVEILADLDMVTSDILRIDRSKYVLNSGVVSAITDSTILENSNSQFQFNTNETKDIVFSLSNETAVSIDRFTASNDETIFSIIGDSTNINAQSFLRLTKGFLSPSSLQEIGSISFQAGDSAGSSLFEYAGIVGKIEDNSSVSKDGSLRFDAILNNSITPFIQINDSASGHVDILTDLDMTTKDILNMGGGTINLLTADGSPDGATDFVMTFDASAAVLKKVLLNNLPGGGSGDVVGPGSSTNNAIARFDGVTGKIIQNSLVTIDDTTGNINIPNLAKITGGLDTSVQHIQAFGTTSGIAGDSSWAINIGQTGFFQVSDSNGIKFRVAGATVSNNSLTEVVDLSVTGTGAGAGLTLATGASIIEFSTDGTLAGDSDTVVPTEQAVRTFVEAQVGGANTALSNLTTTSINQTFQLDTDNLYSLGTPSVGWRDLNINTINIQDSAGTFNPSSGSTQIRADTGGMNLGVPFSSDVFDFFFGGSANFRIAEDEIEFLTSGRDHKIIAQSTSLKFETTALTDFFEFFTGAGRSNTTFRVEDVRTSWFTDNTETSAVLLQLVQNNNTPADFRTLGNIDFIAENSVSADTIYARVSASSQDITSGTEDGLLQLGVVSGGTLIASIDMEGDSAGGSLIGFFGVPPVAQQSPAANSAAIIAALENLGLFV